MKRSVLMVLAVVLVFTGVFTGVTIWQRNRSMAAFASDGYVLGGEAETGVVSCDYFSAGTRYSRNYDERMVFTSTMGGKESVDKTSFIHYTDESLSSFSTGILVDMEQVASGIVNSYFVDEKMVLTKEADGYSIDNNGTDLQFGNLLWMVDDMKFLVYSDTLILTLPNGSTQEVAGYLEAEYIDDSVVQICNEEQIWQTVPTGASITLDNGVVIDLATGDITGGGGTVQANLSGILADLMTGGGVAIASTSAQDWRPPEFEFEAIDGQDGEDGEDGEEGEAGEAGEEGEAGQDGEEGESGEDGDAGEEGQSGSDGVSGGSGESGEKGQGGAAGGSAAPGAAGSTEVNSALAQVLISSLEYDCAQMDISFYAVEADTLVPGTAWLQVIESDTNQEVARSLVESWETDLAASSSIETVNVHVGNLQADTRYTVLIYSGYKVGENGTEGEKVFASRTFYTSDDGVEMKLGAVSENAITVDLDRQDYSTIQSGMLCVTFTYTDETGTTREYRLWSDSFDLGSSTTQVLPLLDEEGNPVFEGLKSNIPFTVELFTSTGAYNVTDGRWKVADDDAAEPDGVAMGTVDRSDQVLEGKTLKETPTYGSLQIYQSTQGCYMISVNDIQDPDTAIQNYNYKIYSMGEDGSGEKTLVKQLYSATGSPVELYVDEDVIEYNHWYYVECTINYHDNEKPYSLIVTNGNENPFQTGTGQAAISFVEGTLTDDSRYEGYQSIGPSYLFGNLVLDTSEAGFSLDLGQTGNTTSIRVDVSSGGDYVYSMSYDRWEAVDQSMEEDQGAELDGAKYDADNHKLYLPVDLWGLKQDSAYTFSVYAYVKYSDASSAYKYVGNTLAMTQLYGSTQYSMETGGPVEKKLGFTVQNLTGQPIDADAQDPNDPDTPTYDKEFAVGISLQNQWQDGRYPQEVTALRGLQITVTGLDNSGNPIGSSIVQYVDLYEKGGLIPTGGSAVSNNYIWLSQENGNPVIDYLEEAENAPSSTYLCTLSTSEIGDVSAYTNVRVEVTGAYDYTYQMAYGFPLLAPSNVSGYYNEIPHSSNQLEMPVAGDNTPSINDYEYRDNRDEAVQATEIRNTGDTGSSFLPITEAGGTRDSALQADMVRGYRLEADFSSSTMASITYYIFTYDDWVAYGRSQDGDQENDTDIYQDIAQAAVAHKEAEPEGYWADKVTAVTITIDETKWDSIRAPFLDVIYVDNPDDASDSEEAEWNEDTGGYVYYTNELKRGQTYLFSFSEWDRCEQDEYGTPLYQFPYDDNLYEKSNKLMIRSKPQQMDRQAPEVQMTLDHTTLDGEQVWSFTAYDPDQALGIVDSTGERKTWQKLYDDLGAMTAIGTDWSLGYILGTTSDGMQSYTLAEYPALTQESLNTYSIAQVEMSGSAVKPLPVSDITAIYDYRQSNGDGFQVITDASGGVTGGISWKGTFTLTPPDSWTNDNTIYSIHLGRVLNDSAYVTNESAADTDAYEKGAGYELNKMTSLRYMAAATNRYEKVHTSLKKDDGTGESASLVLEAQLVGGNVQFYVASSNGLENRIVALEVEAWMNMGTEENPDWEARGTKRLSYTPSGSSASNIVASFNIADLGKYQANRPAAVRVRAIYDTGLYGSRQDVYLRSQEVQNENLSWLWNAMKGTRSYLVRQQKAGSWYIGTANASYADNSWKLSGTRSLPYGNLVWQYNDDEDKEDFGIKEGAWYLRPYNIISNTYHTSESRILLENAAAAGTGYLEETAYYNAASGGWTDRENSVPVVLGALGMTDAVLQASAVSPEKISVNDQPIRIDTETFQAGTLFTFSTPESTVQFSENLSITSSMDTATVELTMPGASLKKMDKGDPDNEYEFYPYLFLELREGTTYMTSGTYKEGGDDKIYKLGSEDTHGTLLTDQKYFGPNVIGAAGAEGTEIIGGKDNKVLKALPAVRVDVTDTGTANTFKWVFRNLRPEENKSGDNAENYSLRVYVLPVRYENSKDIDYSTLDETEIENLKHYVLDYTNMSTGSGRRYYDQVGYNCWYRLTTNARNAFKTANPVPKAEYSAESYDSKTLEIVYDTTNQFRTNVLGTRNISYTVDGKSYDSWIYDEYIEYRIVDENNTPVLDHAAVMAACGYMPVKADLYEYDSETGDETSERTITVYVSSTDPSTVYRPGTDNVKLSMNRIKDLLDDRKLIAGGRYTLQARICYTDSVLPELKSEAFTVALVKWDPNTEDQQVITAVSDPSLEISFTIPAGSMPSQVVGASYTDNDAPKGLKMTLNLRVVDAEYYNTAVWGSDGALHSGEIYVKILEKSTVNDVTKNFTCNGQPLYTEQGGYARLATNTQHALVWDRNPNYRVTYYDEVWGTINGIKHITGTACECGQTHTAGEVDKYGNIRLATSTPGFDMYLTMPDESGIAILSTVVSYTSSSGRLTLNVLSGSGIDQLTGTATLSVSSPDTGAFITVTGAASWSGNICSFTIPAVDRDKIKGNCSATFVFTNADGTVSYTVTQGFVAN